MARLYTLVAAMAWLCFVADSAGALPQPPETAAERSFRLAGFSTSRQVGCCWSVAVFKAGPNVGDAELKSLVDPGQQFILDLSNSRVSNAGIKELARFSKIYQLNLGGTRATIACLTDLTKFKYLTVQLDPAQITAESTRLSKESPANFILNVDPINDAAFHSLAEAHWVHLLGGAMGKDYRRVESDEAINSLSLQSKEIPDASMKEVASLKNLASLQLINCAVTDAGVRELGALRQLSKIEFRDVKVTDAGLKEIARLESLKSLAVFHATMSGTGLQYLADRDGLSIELDEAVITPENLKEISQGGIPHWVLVFHFTDRSLHALRQAGMLHLLSGALAREGSRPRSADEVFSFDPDDGRRVTAAGYKELGAFKNLQKLDLQFSAMNDATHASVMGFERLATLDLSNTQITNAGLKLLASQRNLTMLNVQDTGVTKAGVAELQLALPNCVIRD